MKIHLKYLLIAFVLYPLSPVFAENDTRFDFNLWASSGQTKWRHDASMLNPDYGVPSSELDYQNVNSNVAEIRASRELNNAHQVRLTIGTGFIDSGTLVDDDYVSASGAVTYNTTQTGAHRFSRTHSDIEGNGLFYLKGEFLPAGLAYKSGLMELQASFGLHYWEEEYVATGIRQIECTALTHPDLNCAPAGTVAYTGITVITNTVQWTGLGLGFDSKFDLIGRLELNIDFTYYPILSLVNEDIHHLRTDLNQDPSVRMTGNGTGYDLFAGFNVQFRKELSAHIGYRVWERRVNDQVITFYDAYGGSSSANLMDFTTRREGFMGGITLIF